MHKIKEQVTKELTEIGEKGVNASNLELVSKLVDILKDIGEIEQTEEGGKEMYGYGRYRDEGYGAYRDEYEEGYGRRGGSGGGRGHYSNSRMRDHMERMMDGMDQYEYGKERYMHGGDESRVMDGLEKLMYAMCMFVESAMDFADTPQEKEIIRKHIQKMKHI